MDTIEDQTKKVIDKIENQSKKSASQIILDILEDYCEGFTNRFNDEDKEKNMIQLFMQFRLANKFDEEIIEEDEEPLSEEDYEIEELSIDEILEYYDYDESFDILLVTKWLTICANDNDIEKQVELCKRFRTIDEILYNGENKFTIISSEYGSFTFSPATEQETNNKKIKNFIERYSNSYFSHDRAKRLMLLNNNYTAITSVCDEIFGRKYYHSYILDTKNNKVIDLTNNIIMEKESYDLLFRPQELSQINLETFKEKRKEANKWAKENNVNRSNWSYEPLVTIAIMNQINNLNEKESQLIKE